MKVLENWCTLPTMVGSFRMYDTGDENVRVISMGDLYQQPESPLMRVHSSCLASEVFGAQDCDCADQLRESMKKMAAEGHGIVVHLHQEGRGQGLSLKIKAVRLMESDSLDTVESFEVLGLEQDVRTYQPAVDLLQSLNIKSVHLVSNNPRKKKYLEKHGIEVLRVNTNPNIRPENKDYLHSKNEKLGHMLPLAQVNQENNEIRFYHSDQPWGEFSNFSQHSIYIDGINWKTVEHYYQASKFSEVHLHELIRIAASPTLAKEIAKKHSSERIKNWESVKESVMKLGLMAKFSQHPELRTLLGSTGQHRLVEFTSNDEYWGENSEGIGANRLGILLMEVRSQLLEE